MRPTSPRVALVLLASVAGFVVQPRGARAADERPLEQWDGYLLDTPVGNYPFQVEIADLGGKPEARAEVWPPAAFDGVVRGGDLFSMRMRAFFGDLQLSGKLHDAEVQGTWEGGDPPGRGVWRAWRRPSKTEDGLERRRAAVDRLLELMRPLYPFWDRKRLEPERLQRRWRDAAARTSTRESFLREMGRLLAAFHDGHTSAVSNPSLQALIKGRVNGVRVDTAGDRFFLVEALPGLADLQGGPVEILSVDGEPVGARARRMKRDVPLSSSSPRHLQHLVCGYLLSGPPERPAVVKARAPGGRVLEIAVPRGGPRLPTVEWRPLSAEVGYIRVRRFDGSGGGIEAFEEALEKLRESSALLLDLRDNGGGTAIVGLAVLGRLVTTSGVAATGAYPGRDGFGPGLPLPMSPSGPWQYSGPLVVLTNGGTYSTAEFVAAALRDSGRAVLVGSRTGGGVSNKITLRLPAGLWVSFATMDGRRSNHMPFEGLGVAPHTVVQPKAADLRVGRDPVLEAALREAQRSLSQARALSRRVTPREQGPRRPSDRDG